MLYWLSENISTLIVGAVLLLVVVLILRNMIKKARKGKLSCGCGCSSCPMSGECHSKKESADCCHKDGADKS